MYASRMPVEFLPVVDSSMDSADCQMSDEPRTPLQQCITPEYLTPEQHNRHGRGPDDDSLAGPEAARSGAGGDWTSWVLVDDDVVDVVTTEAAKQIDIERNHGGFSKENCLGLHIRNLFAQANWCGRDSTVAKRGLCAIFSLLIKAPGGTLPLAAVNKDLKWKTVWWRDLGSLYSFVRRTGRDFLSYKNADVSLLHPITTNDVAYIQWHEGSSPAQPGSQEQQEQRGSRVNAKPQVEVPVPLLQQEEEQQQQQQQQQHQFDDMPPLLDMPQLIPM